jgi:hypothetical protein
VPQRRRFGRIRKLPSGRWQARYPDPQGLLTSAPQTFRTKTDADRHLADVQTDIARGSWFDPRAGTITLSEYTTGWWPTAASAASRSLRAPANSTPGCSAGTSR